jgi:hypothetical protein
MRKWLLVPVVVVAALATSNLVVAQTTDPMVGTWKQNIAKSTFNPGPPLKSRTVKFEVAQKGLKVTNDTVDAQGKSTHAESVLTLDGKESPNPNAPQPNTTIVSKRIGGGYETVTRVNGKVTITVRAVVSPDGKTRTMTATGTNVQGQAVHSVSVYDRQ